MRAELEAKSTIPRTHSHSHGSPLAMPSSPEGSAAPSQRSSELWTDLSIYKSPTTSSSDTAFCSQDLNPSPLTPLDVEMVFPSPPGVQLSFKTGLPPPFGMPIQSNPAMGIHHPPLPARERPRRLVPNHKDSDCGYAVSTQRPNEMPSMSPPSCACDALQQHWQQQTVRHRSSYQCGDNELNPLSCKRNNGYVGESSLASQPALCVGPSKDSPALLGTVSPFTPLSIQNHQTNRVN